jgi:hypothetical protein
MNLASLRLFIGTALAECYRDPRPTMPVWQWADRHVFLDGAATPRPGYYRSAETPWVREFCDTLLDPAYTEDLVLKSSRTGFTEAALNCVRYMPENFPGNIVIAEHTRDAAKDVSRGRLARTFAALAAGKFSDDPDDDGTFVKFLRNMTVWIAGSFSKGLFREKWARYIFVDEVEANPEIPDEGFILQQAVSRFTGVTNPTLHAISKPKRHGSLFHKRAAAGTCSVYLVACPHCGTWQELSFDGNSATQEVHLEGITAPLKAKPPALGRLEYEHCRDLLGQWDKTRIARETFYRCVSGCRIDDVDRADYPRSPFGPGRWLVTNPSPHPGRRSRHISDLYSPYAEVAWGQLVLKWLDCTDQLARDDFRNNHLGLPAREHAVAVTLANVLDCRSAYLRGTCPFVPDIAFLTWDTQDDRLKWTRTAWRLTADGKSGECAVVDWGVTIYPQELFTLLDQPFEIPPDADGTPRTATCWRGMGDSAGHRTAEIYDLCLSSGPTPDALRLWPSKGSGRAHTPIYSSRVQYGLREIQLCWYHDDEFKTRLYLERIARIAEHRAWQQEHPGQPCARIHLPMDADKPRHAEDDDIVLELTREKVEEVETRAGIVKRWNTPKGNDLADALKIAHVAFDFVRPRLVHERALRQQAEAAATPPTST